MRDPVEAWKKHVRARLAHDRRRRSKGGHGVAPSGVLRAGAILMVALLLPQAVFWGRQVVLVGLATLTSVACLGILYESYRERRDARSGVDVAAGRAEAALARGAPEEAMRVAKQGLASASSGAMRRRLLKALAWAGIGRRDPVLAHGALLELPLWEIDLYLVASYLGACNRVDEAVELLEEGRRMGHRSPETTKLLADLLFRRGEREAVIALARSDEAFLSIDDQRAISSAVRQST